MQRPFDEYLSGVRGRWHALREREREHAAGAQAALPIIVDILVKKGATRVVLFGSLARGRFGLDSDIDIAVEGPVDVFAAEGEASRATGFDVQVVRLEEAPPALRTRIASEGRDLRELTG